MTHSPAFQSVQAAAQSPGCFRLHTEASNHISFRHAISVRAYSRERHADYAVMLGDFGAEIGPKRVRAVIEDNDYVVAVSNFADCADHRENAL